MKERELTLRALLTGILIGALLTPCNIYSGLKIGWSFNMSIIALLLGFGFWRGLQRLRGIEPWTLKESNIGQTTASSAASIISGGLVAPIPAYTLLTGDQLPVFSLVAWVFAVSFLGIWVAWYLRPLVIINSPLKFPTGIATLETMQDIFAQGREALRKILLLTVSTLISATVKFVHSIVLAAPQWAPGSLLKKLTFSFEPSLLLLGFGAIIGTRVGISLLFGAIIAWGAIAPVLLQQGIVDGQGESFFGPLVEWLIWPGVSLMVAATLTSFFYQFLQALPSPRHIFSNYQTHAISRAALLGFLLAATMVIILQMVLFNISLAMAVLAVPIAVLLATVAARVVGETGIPPIGAIGKVSQLSFGLADPGNTVTNLMTANIAGGAAGQSADLLNDFKAGHGIQASPQKQAIAQCFGIFVGSLTGVFVYVALIPDPATMLLTVEWPAPAVATWKAVAEALSQGFSSIPASARLAMYISIGIGVVLGLSECLLEPEKRRYLLSAPAFGLAFVIPASISIIMCAGALIAWLVTRFFPNLSKRFLITIAAGLVAGESITGVLSAFWQMTNF